MKTDSNSKTFKVLNNEQSPNMPIYVNYNMKIKDKQGQNKFKFTNEKGVPYSEHSRQQKGQTDYTFGHPNNNNQTANSK